MTSLCLNAQKINVNDLISEKTKDVAFTAPNTMLINKKWYMFGKDGDSLIGVAKEVYWILKVNHTGEIVIKEDYSDCSFDEIRPFTWSRDHNNFTITQRPYDLSYRNLVYKDPSASARQKAETKQGVENIIKQKLNGIHPSSLIKNNFYINRLDAKFLFLKGLKMELTRMGESGHQSLDDSYLCTEAGKKEFEEEVKKKAEAAKKKVEGAKKKAEADSLNLKAYDQAREDKYADAIATIDKAIELFPQDPNYYDSKGEILLNMGDKDGAKAMWDKVVSLDPKFSENKSSLYLMLFEPKDINLESELKTFENIGGRIIKRTNGDNSVSISNDEFEKFKEIWQKIVDNNGYLTISQRERAIDIIKLINKIIKDSKQ